MERELGERLAHQSRDTDVLHDDGIDPCLARSLEDALESLQLVIEDERIEREIAPAALIVDLLEEVA